MTTSFAVRLLDRLVERLADGCAIGRIVGKAWFMWLRDQRVPRVPVGRFVRDDQHADTSMTEVHPYEVAGDARLPSMRYTGV